MKKILITGGFGFLGSRLSEFLCNDGYEIFIATRQHPQKKLKIGDKFIKIKIIDWDCEKSIFNVCRNIDFIIHCAGLDSSFSKNNPIEIFTVNVFNSIKLIKAAEALKVKKIIFISTIQVYGQNLSGSINELTIPKPESYYAISKKSAEDILLASNLYNKFTKSYIVRLSNCFGRPAYFSNKNINLIIFDFCSQAINNNQIIVNSKFNFVKNYITANDFCKAINIILQLNQNTENCHLFNLGGKSISLIDLLKKICHLLNLEGVKINSVVFKNDFSNTVYYPFKFDSKNFKKIGISIENLIDEEILDIIRFIKKRNTNFNES